MELRPRDRAPPFAASASTRFVRAQILASKVATSGCVVADVGWPDAPDCTPGYVASADGGCVRFTRLNRAGSPSGGRVYFVDASRFGAAHDIARLGSEPTLVALGECLVESKRSGGNPGAGRVK